MAKPKTALVSKKERLRGAGIQVISELGTDEDMNRAESTLEKGISLCQAKVDSLCKLDPDEVDANQIYKISNAITGLTRAKIESRRWDAERSGMLLQAQSMIETKIRELMAGRPELAQQLLDVVGEARRELEKAPLLVEK